MKNIKREPIKEHFIYRGLIYEPYYTTRIHSGYSQLSVRGPFCPEDRVTLVYKNEGQPLDGLICSVCSTEYQHGKDIQTLRESAHRVYEASQRQKINLISLDLPPTLVKADDENDDYWIEARLGQKQGKLQGLIYMGRKVKGSQKKTDYVQIMLDPDDEQFRFDKSNQNPMDLLSKITVEFRNTIVRQTVKQEKSK
ncbi:MAG: hypothetical protein ABIJ33_00925 [Patescibacteria group bacterium]|nr:hypothetical protein [Patescibacteria group bacterium]